MRVFQRRVDRRENTAARHVAQRRQQRRPVSAPIAALLTLFADAAATVVSTPLSTGRRVVARRESVCVCGPLDGTRVTRQQTDRFAIGGTVMDELRALVVFTRSCSLFALLTNTRLAPLVVLQMVDSELASTINLLRRLHRNGEREAIEALDLDVR